MNEFEDQAINKAVNDDAQLQNVAERLIRSEAGTIGNGHYLVLMRRCDEIVARIIELAASLSVQEEQRRRNELQIHDLHTRLEGIEQQYLHRTSTTEARQDDFENRLERVDRRIYSLQQEMVSKTATVTLSLKPNPCLAAESDISESEASSTSLEVRSDSGDDNSVGRVNEDIDKCSPIPNRAFYRSQGLDVDANPFEMPFPTPPPPPITQASREHSRQGIRRQAFNKKYSSARQITERFDHKQIANNKFRNRSQSNPTGDQLDNRHDNRTMTYQRGPSSDFDAVRNQTATESEARDVQSYNDNCLNYIRAMCKELNIRCNFKLQTEQRYRKCPPPRRLQPMSGNQKRLPPRSSTNSEKAPNIAQAHSK